MPKVPKAKSREALGRAGADESEHTTTTYLRVDAIAEIILNNPAWLEKKRRPDLMRWVQTQWGVKERQAQILVNEALAFLLAHKTSDFIDRKARAIKQRDVLVQRALNTEVITTVTSTYEKETGRRTTTRRVQRKDTRAALAAMRDRDLIDGLFPRQGQEEVPPEMPTKVNVTVNRRAETFEELLKKTKAMDDGEGGPSVQRQKQ